MSDQLLPTTVVGSHAYPSWFVTALEAVKEGQYGITDEREALDDAVNAAILDQERAGVDIISDGEMRRWYFVQGFYQRMEGLVLQPELRKVGVYGYDMPPSLPACGTYYGARWIRHCGGVSLRASDCQQTVEGNLSRAVNVGHPCPITQ